MISYSQGSNEQAHRILGTNNGPALVSGDFWARCGRRSLARTCAGRGWPPLARRLFWFWTNQPNPNGPWQPASTLFLFYLFISSRSMEMHGVD